MRYARALARRVAPRLARFGAEREMSMPELVRALSIQLTDRAATAPERTAIGDDNRISVVVTGNGRLEADVRVGDDCDLLGAWVIGVPEAIVTVGSRVELNSGCVIESIERVEIGDDVLVAADVYIADHDSHSDRWEHRRNDHADRRAGRRDWSVVPRAPVRIESKAWIGRDAMILKGVTIGEGAIVAAGSIVTRSVAPWTLVAGVPATELRRLEPG